MDSFLYKKQVDWSLLKEGFSLPVAVHALLRAKTKLQLEVGERRDIKLLIDGKGFEAKLINMNFDRTKFSDHKEVVQIRYSPNSLISNYFKDVFKVSFLDISARKGSAGRKKLVASRIPEYLCLYATDMQDVFVGEVITALENEEEKPLFDNVSEQEWESCINTSDPSAKIIRKTRLVKIRSMDRSIADSLKSLYQYQCQVCGCSFCHPYDSNLIHAHHINPFVKSQNNNPENIMILCPNHHGIVHDVHPEFDFKTKVFHYPNGYTEALKINLHL